MTGAWLTMLAAASEAASDGAGGSGLPTAVAPLLRVVLEAGLALLALAMVLCVYRVMRGPSLADRVLAVDTLALNVTGIVIVLAIRFETTIFFDAALVVGIIGFVSTVAFAQYIGALGADRGDT